MSGGVPASVACREQNGRYRLSSHFQYHPSVEITAYYNKRFLNLKTIMSSALDFMVRFYSFCESLIEMITMKFEDM
jgi:hypothetical protein